MYFVIRLTLTDWITVSRVIVKCVDVYIGKCIHYYAVDAIFVVIVADGYINFFLLTSFRAIEVDMRNNGV